MEYKRVGKVSEMDRLKKLTKNDVISVFVGVTGVNPGYRLEMGP